MSNITRNTSRYVEIFESCADEVIPVNSGTESFPDIFDNLYVS